MKKYMMFLSALVMAILLPSCSDDNQEARTPVASYTVNSTTLHINESMEIDFTGVADQVIIFPGDNLHEYVKRAESHTGYVVNKGVFTYSYSTPGVYHVTIIASTYDTYLGENLQTAIAEFDVTVIDDVTTIDGIMSSINPNEYYAELVNESDWVLRLPTKQVYNGREAVLNATRQRLTITVASDSSKIYVDDVEYSARTNYNLTLPHDIRVVAYSGDERSYKLYTLIYPEFTSLTTGAGKAATTLTRTPYYQDLLTYTLSVPESELSSVVLNYTVDSQVKFCVNGTEVASGTAIDLTDATAEYTLVRTFDGRDDLKAVTRIVFETK
ncbi:MAG: hypothetical protein IJ196_03020 [Prevotella sp.]|nr:hypothetical protein [Prevotella sp.]